MCRSGFAKVLAFFARSLAVGSLELVWEARSLLERYRAAEDIEIDAYLLRPAYTKQHTESHLSPTSSLRMKEVMRAARLDYCLLGTAADLWIA
jgi:hypothetical protein